MDMLQARCIIGLIKMKKSHKTNCWYVDKYLLLGVWGDGDYFSPSFGRYVNLIAIKGYGGQIMPTK